MKLYIVERKTVKIGSQTIRNSKINRFIGFSKILKSTVGNLFVEQKDVIQSVRQARGRVIKRIYGKDI